MATGLPVISTQCGGLAAFVNAATAFVVRSEMVDAPQAVVSSYEAAPGARWCEPRVDDVADHMRSVHVAGSAAREIGKRGRKLMVSNFSIPTIGHHTARLVNDAASALRGRSEQAKQSRR